jgi:WD40 repeat protein
MQTPTSTHHLAFSPDGCRLLSSGRAAEITVWNAYNGRMLQSLSVNSTSLSDAIALAFLPDARGAVSAGEDGDIHIWRLPD